MQADFRLNELDRKVILFSYEHQYRGKQILTSNLMNDEYRAFIITEGEYILWELEKRKLMEAEIVAHAWLITSQENVSLLFDFEQNNHVTICSLFDDEQCNGTWKLEHGILKVCFEYRAHGYDINIIANNNRSVHSALQIVDNETAELLKVAPLSHAKNGKSLLD